MLTINQLTGFAARGKHAQASYIATSSNTSLTTGTNDATFSSINLGSPAPNRIIAVAITGYVLTNGTAALTINSVTVGGISAAIVANKAETNTYNGGEGSASCIAYIEESTLSSGNIVVNYTCSEAFAPGPTDASTDLTIAVYNITNQNNNTPYNTSSNSGTTGTSISENISVPLLGCTIGAANNGGGGSSNASWTHLTQDVLGGNAFITGHNNTAAIGTLSVTVNATLIVCTTLSLASWQ